MKAQVIETTRIDAAAEAAAFGWSRGPSSVARGLLAQARGLEVVAMLATRLALALLPALAIVTVAALAVASPDLERVLYAALWSVGFLFYGMAIDRESPLVAALLLASGGAVQALTWFGAGHAPELALAAAALAAAWAAGSIAARLFRNL